MPDLTFRALVSSPLDVEYSHITDLAIYTVDGADMLFATTRFDGMLSSWNISGNGLTAQDAYAYEGGLQAGGTGSLEHITFGDTQNLITGGTASGGLALRNLGTTGSLDNADNLAGTVGFYSGLHSSSTFGISQNRQAVYGGLAGNDGIGRLLFDGAGNIVDTRLFRDTTSSYAAAVSDTQSLTIGSNSYLFAASSTEHGVSAWRVEPNGVLTLTDSLGVDEGLWVATPTALASVQIDGTSYLLLGAAGSSSISVMEVDATGEMHIRDHLLDTRDTRFGGITALEVVTHNGQVFVIAGGADDGISVLQMLPGGQLVTRATFADTTQTGLANISDIAVRTNSDGLDIFVSSSAETGITQLRYEGGGTTLQATNAGGVLTGGNGDDILRGIGGDDTLRGGAGDDILNDGTGEDVMFGGAGADVFVLTFDGLPDIINDFTIGEDRIDLSGWPMVRDISQLTMSITATGMRITYGDEVLTINSANGQPIDHRQLTYSDLIGGTRIPQVILPGYPGPYVPIPDLPGRFVAPTQDGSALGFNGQTIAGQFFYDPRIGGINNRTFYGRSWGETHYAGAGNDRSYGRDGNDRLYGGTGSDRLYGGNGNDRLVGSSGDDRLEGNADNDMVIGGTGRDRMYGGFGHDRLTGGNSDDIIFGEAGFDRIWGGNGNDRMYGGYSADSIWGGNGHDYMTGGTGYDHLSGGNGNDVMFGYYHGDRLFGGNGYDRMYGGGGNDTLFGGNGYDEIYGGLHNDKIWGGNWKDKLLGGSGNDTIWGGPGDDGMWGNAGNDVMIGGYGDDYISGGYGADRMYGGEGRDRMYGMNDNDLIYGRDGHDSLWGNNGNDRIYGDNDNDAIFGGFGNDYLVGGEGHDTLDGGLGDDVMNGGNGHDDLFGGDGNDVFSGGASNDEMFGGAGNDRLYGSLDNNTLDGGTGDDLLWGGPGRDQFIFRDGQDSVMDFEERYDRIGLDHTLWDGNLQPGDVWFLYGSIEDDVVTLDFENGNTLTIHGITDAAAFTELIDLV